jgi:hypothetical protein
VANFTSHSPQLWLHLKISYPPLHFTDWPSRSEGLCKTALRQQSKRMLQDLPGTGIPPVPGILNVAGVTWNSQMGKLALKIGYKYRSVEMSSVQANSLQSAILSKLESKLQNKKFWKESACFLYVVMNDKTWIDNILFSREKDRKRQRQRQSFTGISLRCRCIVSEFGI